MKAIITGSTGMVGKGVLLECLDNPSVSDVLVINRRPLGLQHPKLKEIIHGNFFDLSAVEPDLKGYNACFFCLGTSAFGMKEKAYHRITYELTLHVASTLTRLNPNLTFCYVSGQGTDSSEKGNVMWARVKGKTENALLALPFRGAYMFRPGYIHPLHGIKSSTALYNALYTVLKPLYPLMKSLFPNGVTTTQAMGKAMIAVAFRGTSKPMRIAAQLNPADINLLARQ
ncbi:MAG: epimerase [Ferruginibacter sp.]|nr:epimerase [Cytophagales bacterium]